LTNHSDRQAVGRRLRDERERRHITLDAIAATTKIKASVLARLEEGDVSSMPGGIFRRGYVREYAAAIGLAPDSLVAEFVRLFDDGEAAAEGHTPARRSDLRLTLALDTRHEAAATAIDVAVAIGEAGLLVAIAAAIAATGVTSFWPLCGAIVVAYYATANALLGRSPARWFLENRSVGRPTRGGAHPQAPLRFQDRLRIVPRPDASPRSMRETEAAPSPSLRSGVR
jgi:transcriptional regulator with XRE-family HTH domain